MSIQWTFIAGYLYLEVGIVIIMMLPIASPRRWRAFFKSRLFAMFQESTAVYFYVLLGVLSMFLLDAMREMRKYSHTSDASYTHLTSEMKGNVKLFRAQRNFYITGFSIFLAFVIRRLVTMILVQAELLDRSESIVQEAETAKNLAKTTVLGHSFQTAENVQTIIDLSNKVDDLKELLKVEKERCENLEAEALKWQTKYESIAADTEGTGDK